jgi:hypothetical protein
MNKRPSEVKAFIEELKPLMPESSTLQRGAVRAATHLGALSREKYRRVGVGAQNISQFDKALTPARSART